MYQHEPRRDEQCPFERTVRERWRFRDIKHTPDAITAKQLNGGALGDRLEAQRQEKGQTFGNQDRLHADRQSASVSSLRRWLMKDAVQIILTFWWIRRALNSQTE